MVLEVDSYTCFQIREGTVCSKREDIGRRWQGVKTVLGRRHPLLRQDGRMQVFVYACEIR